MLRILSDNLLAVKFLTLFGNGASPDAVQRRNAGRQSRNAILHSLSGDDALEAIQKGVELVLFIHLILH